MSVYYDNVKSEIKEYFRVLEPEFPEWLNEYIDTPEMLAQARISTTCGTIYSNLFPSSFFYSSLDHSVGVALIVWHFTHDVKQTLAGLFHDIATPAFKHCVDFLNGDYLKQESTEDLTTEIISGSSEIMTLLARDGISVSEVDNYHLYSIADNDTPKLSADRLEYSLSNSLFTYKTSELEDVRRMYEDLTVLLDAEGVSELGFQTAAIGREFVKLTSKLSVIYRDDRTRFSMQLIADVLKGLSEEGMIAVDDLYHLGEDEVIDLIGRSRYAGVFERWRKAKEVSVSIEQPDLVSLREMADGSGGIYAVNQKTKVRYIDPLCGDGAGDIGRAVSGRMSEICEVSRGLIEENLGYEMDRWAWVEL